MSQAQKDQLDAMLRGAPLDLGGDVVEQREIFTQMLAGHPLPADVRTENVTLGGIPAIAVDIDGAADPDRVILYFHGGAYAIGSAATSLELASDVARRAGSRTITVDYRLAPEHPYPAALDDAVAAYRGLLETVDPARIAIVGESAGGGLALAALIAIREAGLPLPASAAVFSPWADLTVTGASVEAKAAVDPSLTAAGLLTRAKDYVVDADPETPTVSPVFADFTGLPSLLVQVGSHEILLDDALRVVARAAAADVDVRLHVVAGAPHVFQSFAPLVDEASAALDEAAAFLREKFETATTEARA